MYYLDYEKAITSYLSQTITELALISPNHSKLPKGFIYTFLCRVKMEVKIGHTFNMCLMKENMEDKGSILIGKRNGNLNEFSVLQSTLYELGHEEKMLEGYYNYSNILIRHLNLLGWPIGDLGKLRIQKRM
tara:strand:- start:131 stop:523 length:393 start_codon:yes stop_codon:yes gene_type:complete